MAEYRRGSALGIDPKKKFRALIFPETKQIACVIIQALFGGSDVPCQLFDDWATAPGKEARWAEFEWEQWQILSEHWNAFHKSKRLESSEPSRKAK